MVHVISLAHKLFWYNTLWCHITLRYSWNVAFYKSRMECISLKKTLKLICWGWLFQHTVWLWDACWFQSRLSKNKETKCLTVLQLIPHELLSCVCLWLEQLCHKDPHILTRVSWKSLWSIGFAMEVLQNNACLCSIIRLGHTQYSAVLQYSQGKHFFSR